MSIWPAATRIGPILVGCPPARMAKRSWLATHSGCNSSNAWRWHLATYHCFIFAWAWPRALTLRQCTMLVSELFGAVSSAALRCSRLQTHPLRQKTYGKPDAVLHRCTDARHGLLSFGLSLQIGQASTSFCNSSRLQAAVGCSQCSGR